MSYRLFHRTGTWSERPTRTGLAPGSSEKQQEYQAGDADCSGFVLTATEPGESVFECCPSITRIMNGRTSAVEHSMVQNQIPGGSDLVPAMATAGGVTLVKSRQHFPKPLTL